MLPDVRYLAGDLSVLKGYALRLLETDSAAVVLHDSAWTLSISSASKTLLYAFWLGCQPDI